MATFGERLKELRFHSHRTQKQVADDLGMTFSALSQYETGKRKPKNDVLMHLASYFNVSVDYLLGLDDNPVKHYDFSPINGVSIASSPKVHNYDYNDNSAFKEIDESKLNSAKTRVLAAINSLPDNKQIEILTAIELLLGTISGS